MPDLGDRSTYIGLTSTIPVEIVFAAGLIPVDLNNLFITDKGPEKQIKQAESDGFAHNICAWIKGIYTTVSKHDIRKVIAVTGGDCSNTIALAELLDRRGVRVLTFDYPLNQDRTSLKGQMEALRKALWAIAPTSVTWTAIGDTKKRLDKIRRKLWELDRLTFEENVITGLENHLFLVNSSDFKSDPDLFESELDVILKEAKLRKPLEEDIRLGYLGVPPIFDRLYETVESFGARVVFNEVQRQFSMPFQGDDLVGQYLNYTYPYKIEGRIGDIKRAVLERKLDGLIHYTQTFCYRQIYDIILKESLNLPILTLEGDRPGPIDGRTALRLETFIEMLRNQKSGN